MWIGVSQSKDVLQQFIVRIGFLGTCCAGSAVYDLYDLLLDSGYYSFFFFFLVGRLRASCHALDMYECR